MRIIAGEFRSRVLQTVPGLDVRPTPDRLRETLFNILATQVPGSVFLDAYAGSGAVGIEALSRGAERACFIENSKVALPVIERNLKTLGISDRAMVLRGSVRKKLTSGLADIVFLDPPYPRESEYEIALHILGEDTRVRIAVAQHGSRFQLAENYGALHRYRELRQGENALSFYAPISTYNTNSGVSERLATNDAPFENTGSVEGEVCETE